MPFKEALILDLHSVVSLLLLRMCPEPPITGQHGAKAGRQMAPACHAEWNTLSGSHLVIPLPLTAAMTISSAQLSCHVNFAEILWQPEAWPQPCQPHQLEEPDRSRSKARL